LTESITELSGFATGAGGRVEELDTYCLFRSPGRVGGGARRLATSSNEWKTEVKLLKPARSQKSKIENKIK